MFQYVTCFSIFITNSYFSSVISNSEEDAYHKFTIYVQSSDYNKDEEEEIEVDSDEEDPEEDIEIDPDQGCCFTLEFEYTEKYPDENPVLLLLDTRNLCREEKTQLMTYMEEQVSFNNG